MAKETNYYVAKRKECGLSRERASEIMNMSSSRLEWIEKDPENHMDPRDVLLMEEAYGDHEICNYFCSETCPLGQKYVPKVSIKSFGQIAIETLNCLNRLNKDKERLLEIVEDGELTADELEDFERIQDNLERISLASSTLQLWLEKSKKKQS